MPQFQTQNAKGKKEDLASFISMITRDETPFMSSISNKKATAVYHEWQTDALGAPSINAVGEGTTFDLTKVAISSTTRVGNYSQILSKHIQVSKTLDTVSKAGRNSEFAYQMKKKGTEMKRDLEFSLVGARQVSTAGGDDRADTAIGNPSVAGGAGRQMGGVQSFIPTSNVFNVNATVPAFVTATSTTADGKSLGIGNAVATTTAGDGTVTVTPGAPAGWRVQDGNAIPVNQASLVSVDEVMQKLYEEGGKATVLMMSPSEKRKFSALAQSAGAGNVRRNIDDSGTLRQSVELYESDFGLVKVVPNYIQGLASNLDSNADITLGGSNTKGVGGASDIIIYDPSWWSMATLRPLHTTEIGNQGDSTTSMIIEETTLECRNTNANGMISGIGAITGAPAAG